MNKWRFILFLAFVAHGSFGQNVDSLEQVFRSNAPDSVRFDAGYELTYAMLEVSSDAVEKFAYPTFNLSKKLPLKFRLSAAYQMAYLYTGYVYDSAFKYIAIADSVNQLLEKDEYNALIFDLYAQFYESIRDFERAVLYYEAELEAARVTNDTSALSTALNNLAGLNFELQRLPTALAMYQESLELSKAVGKSTLITLGNLVNVCLELEDYDKARTYLRDAHREALSVGGNWEREYYHRVAGNYYMDVDSLRQAELQYSQALYVNSLSKNVEDKAYTLKSLGELYLDEERYDESIKLFLEALKICEEEGFPTLQSAIIFQLQAAFAGKGDYDEAYDYLHAYTELERELQEDDAREKVTALETRYTVEKEQRVREERKQKLEAQARAEEERRANIQYSGIFIGLLLMASLLLTARKFTIPERVLHGFTFFIFILFFEFLLVISDPWIETFAQGSPLLKLLANSIIALLIIPFHRLLEGAVLKRLTR